MEFDFLTRFAVLVGYLVVAANSVRVWRNSKTSWHRKVSLLVLIPPALFWVGFYAYIELLGSHPTLAAWSRLGHSITFFAMLAQQFMIESASKHYQRSLEQALQNIVNRYES